MIPQPEARYRAVLFDLDGTIADTAPDMVAVLQEMQRDHDREPVDYDAARCNVSNGAVGLLRLGFPDADDQARSALMCDYVDRYARNLCHRTALFGGINDILLRLEQAGRPWGVVTNKPGHLTNPLLDRLALAGRFSCAVSGDTLPQKKPHPAPLLHACRLAAVKPEETIYVGDAARDIEAGRRAGMMTVAAAYGYVAPADDPLDWGADALAADTAELAQILFKAVTL